ncbi:protein kinase [Candidatus Uabimicrobium sp. HlEnr_7]|uniref:serine/threonine protein kinase n=1 Tax=Candidatus Uabimicrobium helgolandensis TaxID=3095367 RepID=UPI003558DE14
MAIKIGQTVDNYLIVEKIGSGGNGVVYKAKYQEDFVAVKFPISNNIAYDTHLIESFKNEISAITRLEHPYIARPLNAGVYKINDEQMIPYLAMEYVEGTPLSEIRNLPTRDAVILMSKVAECITYAHKKRVIHKDLKPSNIIVDVEGNPKILDFGIAKLMDQFSTNSKLFEGSPNYAAPEQFSGEGCDERTDIWTMGVILYELLTTKLPFLVENFEELSDSRVQIFAVQEKVINDKLLKPSKIHEDIDNILDEICLKSMAKAPENRYQSVDEVATRLKQWGRENRDREFKKAQKMFLGAKFVPGKVRNNLINKTLEQIHVALSYDLLTPSIKDLIKRCYYILHSPQISIVEMPLPKLDENTWEQLHHRIEKIMLLEHNFLVPIKDVVLGIGKNAIIPHQVVLVYEQPKGKSILNVEATPESVTKFIRETITILNYTQNMDLKPSLPSPNQIFIEPTEIMTMDWLWENNKKGVNACDLMALAYNIFLKTPFDPDMPNWQRIPEIFRGELKETFIGNTIKTPQQLLDALEKKLETMKIIEKGILDRPFSFPPGEYTFSKSLKIESKGKLELTGKTTLVFEKNTGISCHGQIDFQGEWNPDSDYGSITLKPLSSREGWQGIQILANHENINIIKGCNIESAHGVLEEKSLVCGGAIHIQGGNFRIQQCRFSDNKVDGSGGVIHVSNKNNKKANLEVKECRFINNKSNLHGGAISNYTFGKMNIVDCHFENNRALEEGGSVYIRGLDSTNQLKTTIASCHFIENRSNMSGGATYCGFFTHTLIKNSYYDSNISEDSGGAIATIGNKNISEIIIDKSKFVSNRCQNRGGAILAKKNTKLTIKDSRFDGNTSIRDSAGAIAIDGKGSNNYSVVELTKVAFVENRCHIDGGAINANLLSKVICHDCRFEGNYTENNSGGAVVLVGNSGELFSEGEFHNTVFIRNRCKQDGGAVNANLYTKTLFESCRFKNNSCDDSGGAVEIVGEEGDNFSEALFKEVMFLNNRCRITGGAVNAVDYTRIHFEGCQFENNRADEDAGAVYVRGADVGKYSEITFRKTQFIENRSKFSAGAVYLNTLTRSKFEECLFNSNCADSKHAGALLITGKRGKHCTEVSCNKVHFIENQCKANGGAIHLGFYSLCILGDIRFERNNSEGSGGAIEVIGKDDSGPTKLTLKKGILAENSCGNDGGAIAANAHTQMVVSDCSFRANSAKGNCGAIGIVGKVDSQPSKAKFEKVSFIENHSKGDGGAIAAGVRSRLIFQSCNFEGNAAEGSCGALGIAGKDNKNLSDATFKDVEFIDNRANIDGGAMVIGKFSRIKCTKSSFFKNFAETKTGGAILVLGAHPLFPTICNFSEVKFVKNHCAIDGGAINANIYTRNTFENCLFEENLAQEKNGGAVVLLGKDSSCYTEASFRKVHFVKNSCGVSGGAVNSNDFTRSLFVNCIFERNRALSKNGGAVLILGDNSQEPSDAKFSKVQFINNYAAGSGGGVNAHVYTITNFEDCFFKRNIADENGGGVFIRGLRRVPNKSYITGSHFVGNVAENIGPDVALHAVKGVTEASLIEENTIEIDEEEI